MGGFFLKNRFYFLIIYTMYDALQMHAETKEFETYLLVQNRIINECKNDLKHALLQKLDQKYLAGEDVMEVLRMMRN